MGGQSIREPVAIGRFYPQNKDQLEAVIPSYLSEGTAAGQKPWAVLLPHAGYVYCGKVLGATLHGLTLPDTLIILCPNHTGRGKPFGVWPEGSWKMPFGLFPVEHEIASRLTLGGLFQADYLSHLGEHSIEVLLPFLYYACGMKRPSIVPVCIGVHDPVLLQKAAQDLQALLAALEAEGRAVGLIVSSDMNHFESHEVCMRKDDLALQRIQASDPGGLLAVCAKEHITMCGVGPCALAMYAAQALGTFSSTLIAHTSSAEASGNYRQTVGYAGLHFLCSRQA